MSWNNTKDILRQQFSLVSMVTLAATLLMHKNQLNEKVYKISIFDFSELIQTDTNCEPKDITDLLMIYMYVQKLFNPAISSKAILHIYQALQKDINYAQKIVRDFLLVEDIQQTEFHCNVN